MCRSIYKINAAGGNIFLAHGGEKPNSACVRVFLPRGVDKLIGG